MGFQTGISAAVGSFLGGVGVACVILWWRQHHIPNIAAPGSQHRRKSVIVLKCLDHLASMAQTSEYQAKMGATVHALESVSSKLLQAIERHHDPGQDVIPAARQAVLEQVEMELLDLSTRISNLLSEESINTLPLASLLRSGSSPPCCAVDMGGTLHKIIFVDRKSLSLESATHSTDIFTIKFEDAPSLNLRCAAFPSSSLSHTVKFMRELLGAKPNCTSRLYATGGGGHKYKEVLEKELGVKLASVDEMKSVVVGTNYLLLTGDKEVFNYKWAKDSKHLAIQDRKSYVSFKAKNKSPFPYLLVNVGSGVSIIRVDEGGIFQRISGSCLGGGSFYGLCKLLTKCKSYEDMVSLSKKGDIKKMDLLVSDIYGKGFCRSLGLPEDLIASSFGKVGTLPDSLGVDDETSTEDCEFQNEDVVRSLFFMFTNNISQIACLIAEREKINNIIFSGGFIRQRAV